MKPLRTLRRFRYTRMPLSSQLETTRQLARGWRLLGRGDTEPAWLVIQEAHDRSQNAALLHSHAHLLRGAGMLARGHHRAAARELPLVIMAVPAAWLRRAAGIMPGEEAGVGLLATWRMRRDPPEWSD